ncbi:DUF6526 family protein [Acidicapsa ligni]|uniref:DUF6526 family protein n=1 Tax=Acidicapsa ligni TaxID=542300 RepID=UPI0021E0CAA5|nr:DUF6526 family protein [Acidicapsa ligni]
MSDTRQQNLKNHAAFDPLIHIVAAVALLLFIGLSVAAVVQNIHGNLIVPFSLIALSILLFVLLVRTRSYPLKVQDRIIRLEEKLRLTTILSDPLKKRIPELTEDQLIGLRFASDDELPALVLTTLDHKLTRKQIKERIQSWRPDTFRV